MRPLVRLIGRARASADAKHDPVRVLRPTRGPATLQRRLASGGQWADANQMLLSLEEVKAAEDMCKHGFAGRAVPLLERAADICSSSVGEGSVMTLAALQRLADAHYAAGQLDRAQHVLQRITGQAGSDNLGEEIVLPLLSLARISLFLGDGRGSAAASARAVDLCENGRSSTPDMAVLGRALRLRGVAQMLAGAGDTSGGRGGGRGGGSGFEDLEVDLLRAARLGDSSAEQAQATSAMAAFEFSRGGDADSRKEAFQYWDAALDMCADAPAAVPPSAAESWDAQTVQVMESPPPPVAPTDAEAEATTSLTTAAAAAMGEREREAAAAVDRRVVRACVLCNAAEAELSTGVPSDRAATRLAEALRLREEVFPGPDHPAVGWTLALLARSQHLASSAVTAEGLFRAALGKLAFAESPTAQGQEGGTSPSPVMSASAPQYPSPLAPFALAQALEWYSALLLQWERREREGHKMGRRAAAVATRLPLRPPPGLSLHMLHLDDGWGSRLWL